jgi:hypothetical protein
VTLLLPHQPDLKVGSSGPEVGDRQTLSGKIVFVGEAPSPTSDPAVPFSGRPIRWLAWLLKTTDDGLRARVEFRNLLDRYPGRRFPVHAGIGAASALLNDPAVSKAATWLLAGRMVARCFGRRDEEMLDGRTRAAVVPHPSGLNRWWNHLPNRERYRSFFRTILDESWEPRP